MVLATACWSSGQIKELEGMHKKEGVPHGEGVELSFWFRRPYLTQRTLSGIELMEEVKLHLCLTSSQPEIFPEFRDRLAPHQRKLLLKGHFTLLRVAPVGLWPCTGS